MLGMRQRGAHQSTLSGREGTIDGGKLDATSWKGQQLVAADWVPSIGSERGANCIRVQVDGVEGIALIDSGASLSLLSKPFASKAGIRIRDKHAPTLKNASGDLIGAHGRAMVDIGLHGWRTQHECVIADIAADVILGVDFLKTHHAEILFGRNLLMLDGREVPLRDRDGSIPVRVKMEETVIVPGGHEMVVSAGVQAGPREGAEVLFEPSGRAMEAHEICLARVCATVNQGCIPVRLLNPGPNPITLFKGTTLGQVEVMVVAQGVASVEVTGGADPGSQRQSIAGLFDLGDTPLTEDEKAELGRLLEEFGDICSTGPTDLGRTSLAQHRIGTGQTAPIKQAARRIPAPQRQEVARLLQEMQAQDAIAPSQSPWSSPVVLVRKKDGTIRFCVDYRRLNAVTKKDAYPLPRVDDILDTLAGARYFTSLDLASGYWQVEVAPDDREKTAFITTEGLYEFKVLPFGLCNAPGTFQRLMDSVLRGLKWTSAMVYLDDIIVWSATVREHFTRLRVVFQRLREARLKLKPRKCQLLRSQVAFLGHIVSPGGVSTDPAKVAAVKDWAVPGDVKALRSFLGFASYYRRFIPHFATLASPLYRAIEGKGKFHFGDELVGHFTRLKEALTTTPVLALPQDVAPFTVDCDASDTGLGAVLSQTQNGEEKVIGYASRTLTKAERRYCTTRKEMLAMVYGIRHFRFYLHGAKFTVRTDHNSLRWLQSFKEPEGQVARWLEILAPFDFEIVHRPGKLHANADALSRACGQCGLDVRMEEAGVHEVGAVNGMREAQRADAAIGEVFKWLEGDGKPGLEKVRGSDPSLLALWAQWGALELREGLVQRRWEERGQCRYQVVAPRALVGGILDSAHSATTGGHMGVARTIAKVRSRFYWPGLRREVENWVRACPGCGARKGLRRRAPLQQSPSGFPLQRIGVDLLGPLPRTEQAKRYIVVVADYFTRWVEAYAVANIESETVAEVLVNEFIARYGVPREIHTDQGRQFESALFQGLARRLEMTKTRTTPYHPQSDGLVERFNRTLCEMLSQYVNEHHNNWDEQLPLVLMAYRSSRHETTGLTPYYAMFGREVCLPIDIMYGRPAEHEEGLHPYVQRRSETMEEAHRYMREQQRRQLWRQKIYYDKRSGTEEWKEGELVWLWSPVVRQGRSAKLRRPWSGPYKIMKKLSAVTVRIQDCRNARRRAVVHTNRLKQYVRPEGGQPEEEGKSVAVSMD